jgi:hypothetical protein
MKIRTYLSLALLLLLFQNNTAQNEISECLIAKYYFNQGNVNDDIGPLNGTQVGAGLMPDRFGNPNAAWHLSGNPNSYLNLGIYPALKPAVCSISMWFKMDSVVYSGSGYSYNPILLTKCQQGDNCFESYCLYYNYYSQKIASGTTQLPCNQPSVYTSTVTLQTWHHLVLTYDSSNISIYFDGIFQNSSPKNFPTTFLASDSVMIGTSANLMNNRQYSGGVDDIRFYRCVITQQDVTSLYNESNPVTAGIERVMNKESIELYPNPANNKVNLNFASSGRHKIEIINSLGVILLQTDCENRDFIFDLSSVSESILIFRMTDDKGNCTLKKCTLTR